MNQKRRQPTFGAVVGQPAFGFYSGVNNINDKIPVRYMSNYQETTGVMEPSYSGVVPGEEYVRMSDRAFKDVSKYCDRREFCPDTGLKVDEEDWKNPPPDELEKYTI